MMPATQLLAILKHDPENTDREGKQNSIHKGLSLGSLCASTLQAAFRNYPTNELPIIREALLAAVTVPLRSLSTILTTTNLEEWQLTDALGNIYPLVELSNDPDPLVRPFHKLLSDWLTDKARCPRHFLRQGPTTLPGVLHQGPATLLHQEPKSLCLGSSVRN